MLIAISNSTLTILLIGCIVIFALALLNSLLNSHSLFFILLLNSVAALSILLYWTIKQLSITQHYFEVREVVVIFIEVLILCFSLYGLFGKTLTKWPKILTYGIFGTHFIVLVLFLLFVLTFKMKKLF